MNIVDALTIPLGLPAYLVVDELDHGVSAASILAPHDSLLAEHRYARGYAYAWGNIIEARTTSLAWHFVPVALWEQTDELRRAPTHAAAELIPTLQPLIVASLRDRLPSELVLIGCHPQSRRCAHVLFGLVVVDPACERRARRWLATMFLPRVLPKALEACRAQIVDICRGNVVAERSPPHAA